MKKLLLFAFCLDFLISLCGLKLRQTVNIIGRLFVYYQRQSKNDYFNELTESWLLLNNVEGKGKN